MPRTVVLFWFLLFIGVTAAPCAAQAPGKGTDSQEPASEAHKVPVVDGDAGSCSLELTVTDDGKPVYAASIKVHIAYGFGGFHKLDLEASTNVDGKVKFTGLPARVRRPPLEFNASKDQLAGTANYDPSSECTGRHEIALQKPDTSPGK